MAVSDDVSSIRDDECTNSTACSSSFPPIHVVDVCGSTNDDVKELARQGAPHGAAVAAHQQTQGRGRRGHVWQSPYGGLYLSVLLRPTAPMMYFVGLPAVCALGVAEALDALGVKNIALKWPNDIVIESRKLAGVLVEGGSSPDGVYAVVGVGLNIAAKPQEAQSLAHSISQEQGKARPLDVAYLQDAFADNAEIPSFEKLAQAVRCGIVARCDAWDTSIASGQAAAGPLAPVLSNYFDRIELMGKAVVALYPNGTAFARGTLAGIDAWGKAVLITDEGEELELTSEQASLRSAADWC